jgi:NAD(P)-dependent dehydrogenase (short-subunit alcohol dehydrogenase family)
MHYTPFSAFPAENAPVETKEPDMQITHCVALVTGANRGLGRAYCEALLAAGAAKVYAGARDPETVKFSDGRVVPMQLDVTREDQVAAAARTCADVTLLINNAGVLLNKPMLAPDSETALRAEMEVNVFGVLRMVRAFAPVLKRNGGGAIVNMLSVVSWFVSPFNATYCASKHAALAVSDGARLQLKPQGTQVVGVYAGFIDTDMAAHFNGPKTSPQLVAEKTLDGVRRGLDQVRVDARAEEIWHASRTDPEGLHARMQAVWIEKTAG